MALFQTNLPLMLNGGVQVRFEANDRIPTHIHRGSPPAIVLPRGPEEGRWLVPDAWFLCRYRQRDRLGERVFIGASVEGRPFLAQVHPSIWTSAQEVKSPFEACLQALLPALLQNLVHPRRETWQDEVLEWRFGMLWLVPTQLPRGALEREAAFRLNLPDLFLSEQRREDFVVCERTFSQTDIVHRGHRIVMPYGTETDLWWDDNCNEHQVKRVLTVDLYDGVLESPTFGIRELSTPTFIVKWPNATQICGANQ